MPAVSAPRTLHRLIYASRQRVPEADLDHEVSRIIQASIRNNREAAVTGLLLIHDGWFVQALEGPAEAVMTTYGRIVNDPRHDAAKVLAAGPAERREFSDWNMCARRMSPGDDAILDALEQRQAFTPATLSDKSALRLLKAVRDIQSRTRLSAAG